MVATSSSSGVEKLSAYFASGYNEARVSITFCTGAGDLSGCPEALFRVIEIHSLFMLLLSYSFPFAFSRRGKNWIIDGKIFLLANILQQPLQNTHVVQLRNMDRQPGFCFANLFDG